MRSLLQTPRHGVRRQYVDCQNDVLALCRRSVPFSLAHPVVHSRWAIHARTAGGNSPAKTRNVGLYYYLDCRDTSINDTRSPRLSYLLELTSPGDIDPCLMNSSRIRSIFCTARRHSSRDRI